MLRVQVIFGVLAGVNKSASKAALLVSLITIIPGFELRRNFVVFAGAESANTFVFIEEGFVNLLTRPNEPVAPATKMDFPFKISIILRLFSFAPAANGVGEAQ